MSKSIGVVTGGGDCPGLNTVIRAVAKAAAKRGWECVGIVGGYDGLLEPPADQAARLPRAQRIADARRNDSGHGEPREILRESWPRRESRAAERIARWGQGRHGRARTIRARGHR